MKQDLFMFQRTFWNSHQCFPYWDCCRWKECGSDELDWRVIGERRCEAEHFGCCDFF